MSPVLRSFFGNVLTSMRMVMALWVRRSVSVVMVCAYVNMMAWPVWAIRHETFEEGGELIKMRITTMKQSGQRGGTEVRVAFEVEEAQRKASEGLAEERERGPSASVRYEVTKVFGESFETDDEGGSGYESLWGEKPSKKDWRWLEAFPELARIYVTAFGDVKITKMMRKGSWIEVSGAHRVVCEGVTLAGVRYEGKGGGDGSRGE